VNRKTVLIFVAGLTAALGVFGAVYAVYLNTGPTFVALDVVIGTSAMYLVLLVYAQPPLSELTEAARRVADGEFASGSTSGDGATWSTWPTRSTR